MSHYETFVIRLWIEDGGDLGHGVVRHLTSGTGFRFRRLSQATKFIEQVVGGRDGASAPAEHEGSSACQSEDVLIDFERSLPKG